MQSEKFFFFFFFLLLTTFPLCTFPRVSSMPVLLLVVDAVLKEEDVIEGNIYEVGEGRGGIIVVCWLLLCYFVIVIALFRYFVIALSLLCVD
jgi:hypothetical protein